MKIVFYYFLILSAFIVPIFVLFEDSEKFPIMAGIVLGVTLAFWVGIFILKKKGKKEKSI
jgi:Zn-dependent membrane protease YugP